MTASLLREGVVLLGVGLAFVILFRTLGLGSVLGYLAAGAPIGPHALGLVGGGESKLGIAEIGIALMLFVLFAQAQAAQLIEPEAANLFGAIVTLSMATTPFLLMVARRFEFARAGAPLPERPEAAGQSRVLVVGFGRFGKTVSQLLLAQRVAAHRRCRGLRIGVAHGTPGAGRARRRARPDRRHRARLPQPQSRPA